MSFKRIGIGSDHDGYHLKQLLVNYLTNAGIEVVDYGPETDERVDYPDFAHPLANDLEAGKLEAGVLICGSGNGINMAANKHSGVRSALCWKAELACLARQHNNANVLALPARFIDEQEAINCVNEFLNNDFEGGRHQERIDKIPL